MTWILVTRLGITTSFRGWLSTRNSV